MTERVKKIIMRNIIIYRHQLFKPSEGFIVDQTKYLTNFHPIFVGRHKQTEPTIPLDTFTLQPCRFFTLANQILFRDNEPLRQSLALKHPTLIHAHFGVEGVYALPLAKKLKIPLVTTFHGFDATRTRKALLFSKKVSWINYLLYRQQLAREGDLFICVSKFIRDKVLSLGFPEQRVVTHYTGVDTNYILPPSNKKNKKIILHVARLVEVKGTRYLLEAFALLHKQYPDAHLVIIGNGPLYAALLEYAATLGIRSHVTFLGMLSHANVIHWMQQASIFCLPSLQTSSGETEALGMVFAEAAACQLPTVATNQGGIPEIVLHEKTGLLVPERNAQQLADSFNYLLTQESAAERMGRDARTHVINNFNLETQTAKLEKLYNQLLA